MSWKKKIVPYKPALKKTARKLRKNMTLGEVILWQHIRRRQLKGYQFLRQKPIANYIVDFYCKELKLAIEIDGESHVGREKKDRERQRRIEAMGVRFLRFQDSDVKNDVGEVLSAIEHWIDEYEAQQS
jgi:very-short-patch-repair endonuclease